MPFSAEFTAQPKNIQLLYKYVGLVLEPNMTRFEIPKGMLAVRENISEILKKLAGLLLIYCCCDFILYFSCLIFIGYHSGAAAACKPRGDIPAVPDRGQREDVRAAQSAVSAHEQEAARQRL